MPLDPLSPIAPARVRVLLLPVGRIRRSRFQTFVTRLEPQFVVRLGDVSPDGRPDRNMFSPAAFPNGAVIYDFSTHMPPPSHLALSPFELFREPLMILGLADGTEYASVDPTQVTNGNAKDDVHVKQDGSYSMDNLYREMDFLREQYPNFLAHKLLIFDNKPVSSVPPLTPDDVIFVPPAEQLKTTTMKTIICDVTATFLAELTSYARSIQALPTIDSPAHAEGPSSAWSHQSNNSIGLDNARAGAVSHASSTAQLPSFPSDRPSSQTGSRPSTPQEGVHGRPVSESELSTGHRRSNGESSLPSAVARSSAAADARETSNERMSLQGFGSGSLSERNRNRGKGRIGIVIGTFYLIAGRWSDALKELVEGTNRVRAFSDHIWYAKGVENILVCLLLCAWKGIDFEVSSVVSPYAEKAPPPKSSARNAAAGTLDAPNPNGSSTEAARAALVKLSELLPDSLNMIMSIYDRAAANMTEALPDNAFSEVTLRISKLFATLHIFGGTLTHDALEALIFCQPLESFAPNPSSRLFIRPLRQDVAELSFKALPAGHTTMAIGDRVIALAGVASVLSMLGFHRKKAIVIKELLAIFVPSLIDARKAGAAELGIHPAAGLSVLSMISSPHADDKLSALPSEHGFKELLLAIGHVYGVRLPDLLQVPQHSGDRIGINGSNAADDTEETKTTVSDNTQDRIAEEAVTRAFGSLHLKYDMLRTCLTFCEALPDFDGVLQLSAAMLRIAGPAVVPSTNQSAFGVTLAKEEQVRLATNIPRTLGAAKTLGLEGLEVDYWDEFLVRDIHFIEGPAFLQPISHAKSDLDAIRQTIKPVGPFIYDASSKAVTAGVAEKVMVACNQSEFALVLQNPFEFEINIDWLSLAVDSFELNSLEQHLVLRPFCTQTIPIKAVAPQPGGLNIIGCTVKVKGCHEKTFPIFNKPWAPEAELKIKHAGLLAAKPTVDRRASQDLSSKNQDSSTLSGPEPSTLSLTVIPEQPLLEITSVSLSQSSIMILEGERQVFTVTMKNLAANTCVDLLIVSFHDSTLAPIEDALKNKDLPRPEVYEMELQYLRNEAFRLRNPEPIDDIRIEPGRSVDFDFDVLGKPGLSDGAIQFNYAYLGISRTNIKERFFTRKVSLPLSITVNASVMFQRLDIVPFSSDFAWSNQQRCEMNYDKTPNFRPPYTQLQANRISALLDRVGRDDSASDHCLVLLDLRNAWPSPITVFIDVLQPTNSRSSTLSPSPPSTDWDRAYTIHEYLYPGHTIRVLLLLPRLYIQDPYAPIPILDEKNKRQFVRSQGQLNPEAERDMRERFWYREELFKYLKGRWQEESGTGGRGRAGELDLRGIRLSRGMLDSLKLDDVAIEMAALSPGDVAKPVVQRVGRSRFHVGVDQFVVVKTTLRNRSSAPIEPILRLLPALADQPPGVALDLDRRLAWTGLLQRVLPTLPAGAEAEVELGFCALCAGEFEIGALVEETEILKYESPTERGTGHSRGRSGTVTFNESLVKDRGRRVWHASEPCRIVAREEL